MRRNGRCWCFTINFAEQRNYEMIYPEEWPYINCAVFQLEVGENGTEHFQGYVNFTQPVTLLWIKKLPGMRRARLAQRGGTKQQAAQYCWKDEGRIDGPFWYPSERHVKTYAAVENGKRTDIDRLCDRVVAGWTDRQIAENNPRDIFKFQRHVDHLREAISVPGRLGNQLDVIVYVGPTGTGKSHRLRQECPPGLEWHWAKRGKWWDGYQGQPGIVFDEFRDSWCQYQDFLRLVDIGPLSVEKKGSHVEMRAFRFRFSTNVHPYSWWAGVPKPAWEGGPLQRRLAIDGQIVACLQPFRPPEAMIVRNDALDWWMLQPESVPPAARALYGQRMDD